MLKIDILQVKLFYIKMELVTIFLKLIPLILCRFDIG